jgi:hypothetical protein
MQFGGATKIHRKSGFPDFLQRGSSREQLCADFFTESRMQFGGATKIHRKSGFPASQSWGGRRLLPPAA